MKVECTVMARSENGYYSLKLKDYQLAGRIYDQEVTEKSKLVHRKKYLMRITLVDKHTQLVLLSQKSTGNINYILESETLKVGEIVNCRVVRELPKSYTIKINEQIIGNLAKKDIPKKINFSKIILNNEIFEAKVKTFHPKFGPQVYLKRPPQKSKRQIESDFSMKLREALKKDSS